MSRANPRRRLYAWANKRKKCNWLIGFSRHRSSDWSMSCPRGWDFSSCLMPDTLYPLLAQGFCVREAIAVSTRNIRDHDSVENKTRTQTFRVCEQSVSAFSPRKQARPRTGRVLGNTADSAVPGSAAATDSNCPQPVRSRELSTFPELVTDAISPRTWTPTKVRAGSQRPRFKM